MSLTLTSFIATLFQMDAISKYCALFLKRNTKPNSYLLMYHVPRAGRDREQSILRPSLKEAIKN